MSPCICRHTQAFNRRPQVWESAVPAKLKFCYTDTDTLLWIGLHKSEAKATTACTRECPLNLIPCQCRTANRLLIVSQ